MAYKKTIFSTEWKQAFPEFKYYSFFVNVFWFFTVNGTLVKYVTSARSAKQSWKGWIVATKFTLLNNSSLTLFPYFRVCHSSTF
jgi:hypothetical protein